ncbi:hypothetical protein [Halorubrum sp. PV6]|uniref:hypothetical protein n=1 Tax=Halorubrum sp. PV6 TaxID=634157 RepID=UPI000F84FA58|nr:hypothetical protein [Halorubrum sp. PV6]AZQ14023.1 hypothetical protein DOS48_03815 [Halorubrum sp. PV6]
MTERDDSQATDDREAADREPDAETERDGAGDAGADHLDEIEDGVGCTEIWERLSEQRES